MAVKMVIDCDPGHDDAVALVLAHRHAEVIGITTVSGNAPLTATTTNALLVTSLLGADTPVHAGAALPLAGEPVHASEVHGESGLGGAAPVEHERVPASDDAVTFLLEAAAEDVWVVALGPLTNIALAVERDPSWPRRIAGLSLMGGGIGPGNSTATAEFNVFADPEAAARVFESGADLTMCGLNLTRQLRTGDAFTARLRGLDSPAARFAVPAFDFLHGRVEALTGRRSAALHDPCAVLAVTHPELLETQPRQVRVELEGRLTRGMTVVDERLLKQPPAANAKVAYSIDAERALELVVEALAAD